MCYDVRSNTLNSTKKESRFIVNKYYDALVEAYNDDSWFCSTVVNKKEYIIYYDSFETTFKINGYKISKVELSPNINKNFVSVYNQMFFCNTPVRLVNYSGNGPYNNTTLCQEHSKPFWPSVTYDVHDFDSEQKCVCPNYTAFFTWFGNVHNHISRNNMFVEIYESNTVRTNSKTGRQVTVDKDLIACHTMTYEAFYNRFHKNKA